MSIEAVSQVLHHSKATPAGKLVLIGIANHQGDFGAWPAVRRLANYANISERRVRSLLRELEESGELTTRLQAAGNGPYRTNLYFVNVPCPPGCSGGTTHNQGGNNLQQGGNIVQSGGKESALRGEAQFPLTVIEPSLETYMSEEEYEEVDSQFERFWNLYPRKAGKWEARGVFHQAKNDISDIMRGVMRLANDPNLPEERYIPHPANWLKRAGWNDDPYPPRPKTEEELREELRAKDAREREAARIRREKERAEERYEPPPQCEHGNKIVTCKLCIKALAEGNNNG